MKRFARFPGTLLVVMLAFLAVSSSAGAQVPGQPVFDVGKLPGLQEAVSRIYTGDLAALYLGPDGSAPVNGPMFFSVSATVAKFDANAHAAAALRQLEGQYVSGNQSADAFHLKQAQIATIGDGSFAYAGAAKLGQLDGTLGIVVARKGRYIETATGFAMGEDPVPQIADLVTTMTSLDEGGAVTTDGAGLHKGGLWDMLPRDQGVPVGVTPNSDLRIYPTAGSETSGD